MAMLVHEPVLYLGSLATHRAVFFFAIALVFQTVHLEAHPQNPVF
jgi:hypothetical protein